MAFKPIDPKRDEFRRYLERNGVIEALTKAFVKLTREPNRPSDPIAYLRNSLGETMQQADNVAQLRSELNEAYSQIEMLRETIQRINPFALSDAIEAAPPQSSNSGGFTIKEEPKDSMNGDGGDDDVSNKISSGNPNSNDEEAMTSSIPSDKTAAVEDESKVELHHQLSEKCHIAAESTSATVPSASTTTVAEDNEKDMQA